MSETDAPVQAELALDTAAQKDDFAATLEASDQNDPNDLNHSAADEKPEGDEAQEVKAEETEPVTAEAAAKEDPEEDKDAELEQLRKTAKALGKRLGIVTKEKRELSAKLQATIKEVPQEQPEATGEEPQRSDFKNKKEFDEAVASHAQMLIEQNEFNAKCNAVEAAGSKAFGDKWVKAKADLAALDDYGRIPLDILSVALETDNPARVLFVLGNDIERAAELQAMTPIKRAIAMDKIASSKPAVASQSKAPPPIEPLGGKGAGNDRPSDKDSDEEWNRKEELRERRVAEERRKRRGY